MKVGDTIWFFDQNRRVYAPGTTSPPIWRAHWAPIKVIGETSKSWLIGYEHRPTKLPKSQTTWTGYALSEEEIDKAEWVYKNRFVIEKKVGYLNDYDKLKQVAEIIGYKP